MKKFLIVEDDELLLSGLTQLLSKDYQIIACNSVKTALEAASKLYFDLAILDCNLPDGTGFELCETLKLGKANQVLILTARNTEIDEINAFQIGADEFVSKPFSTGVLLERIKRLVNSNEKQNILSSNGVILDLAKGTCRVNDEKIELTAKEYRLICYLIANKNQVLTKEMIVNHIWNYDHTCGDDNSLFAMMSRLRQKVEENPKKPVRIKTIHGLGYIWND